MFGNRTYGRPGTGWVCWTERWTYEGDQLVRHELLLQPCDSKTWAAEEWYGDADVRFQVGWTCNLWNIEPLPRVETWSYDEQGRLSQYTATGWGDSPFSDCIASRFEQYHYTERGIEVESKQRTWDDFDAELESRDCADFMTNEHCTDAAVTAEHRRWAEAGRALALKAPTLEGPKVSYARDSSGRVFQRSSVDGDTQIDWTEEGTTAAVSTSSCADAREFQFNDEGMVASERITGSAGAWTYKWAPDGTVDEIEWSGPQQVTIDYNHGRIAEVVTDGWRFWVSYCQDGKDVHELTRALPLALAADPRTEVDSLTDGPWLPAYLYLGLPTGPMAVPGVWGTGRPAAVVEPGGAAWLPCTSKLSR